MEYTFRGKISKGRQVMKPGDLTEPDSFTKQSIQGAWGDIFSFKFEKIIVIRFLLCYTAFVAR